MLHPCQAQTRLMPSVGISLCENRHSSALGPTYCAGMHHTKILMLHRMLHPHLHGPIPPTVFPRLPPTPSFPRFAPVFPRFLPVSLVDYDVPGDIPDLGTSQPCYYVLNTMLLLHNGHAQLCTGCTMPYWWCTLVRHCCALGAQCHICVAQWCCTIVHQVHNALLVVHNGVAPLCTDAVCGGHKGRAPLCNGCTMPHWWCTTVVRHCALGAQANREYPCRVRTAHYCYGIFS